MPLGKGTIKDFEHRSRESLIEEIMMLRWLRTRLEIHATDVGRHLALLQDAIGGSRQHQEENFGEPGGTPSGRTGS